MTSKKPGRSTRKPANRKGRCGELRQPGKAKAPNVNPGNTGFTKRFGGGPAAHNEAVRTARDFTRTFARRQKAWALFDAGATFEQIGEACGVSNVTAWKDCKAVRAHAEQYLGLDAADRILRQDDRLQALHRAHYPTRTKKDSADVLLGIYKREAQLFGLDAKRDDLVPAEQVFAVIRVVGQLFMEVVADATLRQQFAQGLRQRVGALGPVVEAVPSTALESPEKTRDTEDKEA